MWYQIAAEEGDVYAQRRLGFVYENGEFDQAIDEEEAWKWYQIAAEGGESYAQLRLAEAYKDAS